MKDENGIEIKCENCEYYNGKFCEARDTYPECNKGSYFNPTIDAYKARIAELQEEIEIITSEPSESFYQRYSGVSKEYALGALEQCATEADELQARVKDLESKLTEIVKLFGEREKEEK